MGVVEEAIALPWMFLRKSRHFEGYDVFVNGRSERRVLFIPLLEVLPTPVAIPLVVKARLSS
jgi:hypothetical protein